MRPAIAVSLLAVALVAGCKRPVTGGQVRAAIAIPSALSAVVDSLANRLETSGLKHFLVQAQPESATITISFMATAGHQQTLEQLVSGLTAVAPGLLTVTDAALVSFSGFEQSHHVAVRVRGDEHLRERVLKYTRESIEALRNPELTVTTDKPGDVVITLPDDARLVAGTRLSRRRTLELHECADVAATVAFLERAGRELGSVGAGRTLTDAVATQPGSQQPVATKAGLDRLLSFMDSLSTRNAPQLLLFGAARFPESSPLARPLYLVNSQPVMTDIGFCEVEPRRYIGKDPALQGDWHIAITLDSLLWPDFARLTAEMKGRRIAVVILREVYSAPRVMQEIKDGKLMLVVPGMKEDAALALARILKDAPPARSFTTVEAGTFRYRSACRLN